MRVPFPLPCRRVCATQGPLVHLTPAITAPPAGGKKALLLFRGPLLGALVARVLVVCRRWPLPAWPDREVALAVL